VAWSKIVFPEAARAAELALRSIDLVTPDNADDDDLTDDADANVTAKPPGAPRAFTASSKILSSGAPCVCWTKL
jgi:hypothetical protein